MIVITGGSGFIGSNLLKFLNENQNDEILKLLNLKTINEKILQNKKKIKE